MSEQKVFFFFWLDVKGAFSNGCGISKKRWGQVKNCQHGCIKDITTWAQEHLGNCCLQMLALCFYLPIVQRPNFVWIRVVLAKQMHFLKPETNGVNHGKRTFQMLVSMAADAAVWPHVELRAAAPTAGWDDVFSFLSLEIPCLMLSLSVSLSLFHLPSLSLFFSLTHACTHARMHACTQAL